MTKQKHIKLSVLDLAPITEGSTPAESLARSVELAQLAEALGYTRYWVAEHHNIVDVACAATGIVISHIAAHTQKIRVGSGGIMLPNHAPYMVAEQFGTLAALHPDRIDLGVGRAPGSDYATARALRRESSTREDEFPRMLDELRHFLAPSTPNQSVTAIPGAGSDLQLWLLGSSLYGARLAAYLGLPFVFAAHFAPAHMQEALDSYRQAFRPSEQLRSPYVVVCVNAVVAETQGEADKLATTEYQKFLGLIRGNRFPLPAPVQSMDRLWADHEKAQVQHMLGESIHADPITAEERLRDLIDRTGADEVMVNSWIYDHKARLDSYRFLYNAIREINK
ncbi:LLM class flavin-dependent oxidoreductase [Marinobacterium lutimaris]|uniref:Luciferase-like monooxygenase n=1 Tax=Marinobacterium lutimaris TaxID=568106 RepID=A0A1H5V084_9GAMM|nr:LLM class flavin-dependent oxidoreductase [Marinobacterium lutimaris]SEF80765.1 luciferase family oxidoreductase, group 1 [Marinobacterium lutimaris]